MRAGERNEKCVHCGAAFIYPCLLCVHAIVQVVLAPIALRIHDSTYEYTL